MEPVRQDIVFYSIEVLSIMNYRGFIVVFFSLCPLRLCGKWLLSLGLFLTTEMDF